MDIDLPWEDDPLRDFPDMRDHFMEVWHKELTDLNANYVVISDNSSQRLENGINAINNFLAPG